MSSSSRDDLARPQLPQNEGPFPIPILEEIKNYTGNSQCCDCGSYDTEWASVSYGVLICLRCSGIHRSLGVHVSFVRSVSLDSWTPKQIHAMRIGSNYQMQEFFRRQRIQNSDIKVKYSSKAAAVYRNTLAEAVEKGWQLDMPELQRRKRGGSIGGGGESPRKEAGRGSGSREVEATLFEVAVEGEDSIGISIQKDLRSGRAKVYRVASIGPAVRAGVKAGDELVGIDGRVVDDYDSMMALLPNVGRPFRLVFRRYGRYCKPSISSAEQVATSESGHSRRRSRSINSVEGGSSSGRNASSSLPDHLHHSPRKQQWQQQQQQRGSGSSSNNRHHHNRSSSGAVEERHGERPLPRRRRRSVGSVSVSSTVTEQKAVEVGRHQRKGSIRSSGDDYEEEGGDGKGRRRRRANSGRRVEEKRGGGSSSAGGFTSDLSQSEWSEDDGGGGGGVGTREASWSTDGSSPVPSPERKTRFLSKKEEYIESSSSRSSNDRREGEAGEIEMEKGRALPVPPRQQQQQQEEFVDDGVGVGVIRNENQEHAANGSTEEDNVVEVIEKPVGDLQLSEKDKGPISSSVVVDVTVHGDNGRGKGTDEASVLSSVVPPVAGLRANGDNGRGDVPEKEKENGGGNQEGHHHETTSASAVASDKEGGMQETREGEGYQGEGKFLKGQQQQQKQRRHEGQKEEAVAVSSSSNKSHLPSEEDCCSQKSGGRRRLEKGDKVYVRPENGDGDGSRWRSAIVIRFHKTRSPVNDRHLLKVQYRNGVIEEYVDQDDVAHERPTETEAVEEQRPVSLHRSQSSGNHHRSPTKGSDGGGRSMDGSPRKGSQSRGSGGGGGNTDGSPRKQRQSNHDRSSTRGSGEGGGSTGGSPRKGSHQQHQKVPPMERSRSLDGTSNSKHDHHHHQHRSSSSSHRDAYHQQQSQHSTSSSSSHSSNHRHFQQQQHHPRRDSSSPSSSTPNAPPPRDMREELTRKYSGLALDSQERTLPTSSSRSHHNSSNASAASSSRYPPQPSGRDYTVFFQEGPMGFTLTKVDGGRALVTKVAPAGQGVLGGVRVGDSVISLDHQPLTLYDQIMAKLPHLPRPLTVGFRKRMEGLGGTPSSSPKNKSISSSLGGGGKTFAGGFGNSLKVLQTAIPLAATPLPSRGSLQRTGSPLAGPIGGGSGLTTKVPLDAVPDDDEFDAVFKEGPLGMRLEEKGVVGREVGLRYVSEVTYVNPGGPAEREGVEVGCVVVGINGERFISHAHAVATLKHGKRPVTVRFEYPEEEKEGGSSSTSGSGGSR